MLVQVTEDGHMKGVEVEDVEATLGATLLRFPTPAEPRHLVLLRSRPAADLSSYSCRDQKYPRYRARLLP